MNTHEQIRYVYFLTKVNKLGNTRIKSILKRLPDPYDLFNCRPNDLRKIEGIDYSISKDIFSAFEKRRIYENECDALIDIAEKKKIKIICIPDNEYPDNLRKIYDAPVLIYCKGDLRPSDKYSLSIVGTRNPTQYGKYICEKFTEKISKLGIPVISGFARGIDTIAHKVSLKNDNLTYAVFGCGADIVYPNDNMKLYSEIIERGAVLSEFPISSQPEKVNFPKRNRIISGISLGSLIIESGIKGGSLLTAEFAIDQNKEVFAVPGYINSKQSEGTNELIKKGQAKLVTQIEDIIEELEIKLSPILKKGRRVSDIGNSAELNEAEKTIYNSIETFLCGSYRQITCPTCNKNCYR